MENENLEYKVRDKQLCQNCSFTQYEVPFKYCIRDGCNNVVIPSSITYKNMRNERFDKNQVNSVQKDDFKLYN